jgi:excisionase family DNA binding protein
MTTESEGPSGASQEVAEDAATLTYADVAKLFDVTVHAVKRWVSNGKLKAERPGHRTVRFTERSVREFREATGTHGRAA